ncbi:hypothetical protein AT746_10550 [Lacimicrobium alkaliphilum]|uniref:Uncharacterized protein n=1 Tax=Lacimicrobium alkaliphilum TaxID=1526571 RepID=A0A0U2ZI85_9ALTE|nr:hypothetical protein AT746_10550 [Lacimicrobium alkaliphilum]
MEVHEQYSDEARIQLSFLSFMSVAIWICFGVAFSFAIAFHLVVSTNIHIAGSEGNVFWFASLMYGFLGFIFSLVGSALIYPLYNFWCERSRGQSVKGKFALVHRGL